MTEQEFTNAFNENATNGNGNTPTPLEIAESYEDCLALAKMTGASDWQLVFEKLNSGETVPCFKPIRTAGTSAQP